MKSVVLVGAPGAGVSTVGQELATLGKLPFLDLAQQVAAHLEVPARSALVLVTEDQYRLAETQLAVSALAKMLTVPGVLALGSGCLEDPQVMRALEKLQSDGATVVMLTAPTRTLATRNGLDAPRSIAFGTVRHEFSMMLREREQICRRVATLQVDTADSAPAQTAGAIKAELDRRS